MRRAPVQGRHRNRFVVWRVAAASFAMHGCEAAGWPTPFQCPLNVLVLTVGLLKVFGRMLLATTSARQVAKPTTGLLIGIGADQPARLRTPMRRGDLWRPVFEGMPG